MRSLFYPFLLAGGFATIFYSCKSEGSKLIVASQQADCVGVGPQKCYLVKESADKDWEFLYQDIGGFRFEPGYEYKLEVRKERIENPPADGSSIKYTLIKEISKERKDSENLPL